MHLWYIRGILAVLGLAALVWGFHYATISLANDAPTRMSYAEYCRQQPSAEWLELTDAWVDFRGACEIVTKSSRGAIRQRDYFVPMFTYEANEVRVHAFLKCNELSSRSMAIEGTEASTKSDELWESWAENNKARMLRKVTVKGLVLRGLSENSQDRELLNRAAQGQLDANFVVIDENAEPSGGIGFVLLILGGLLLAGCALTFVPFGRKSSLRQTGIYTAGEPVAHVAYQPPPRSSIPLKRGGTQDAGQSPRTRQNTASPERPPWE